MHNVVEKEKKKSGERDAHYAPQFNVFEEDFFHLISFLFFMLLRDSLWLFSYA